MPKATIREEGQVLGEVTANEWRELAEGVGSELDQLFASGARPASLTVEFDGAVKGQGAAKLTKISAGNYLLGENLRVSRYEDTASGPVRIADWPRDEELWGIWIWEGEGPGDPDSEDGWTFLSGDYPRRRDAVKAASTQPRGQERDRG